MSSVLVLDWKKEPLSPQFSDEAAPVSEDDTLLYWTDLEHGDAKLEADFDPSDSKADIASQLLDHLDHLEDLDEWIKEESFGNCWLEEKMLPIFDIDPAGVVPSKPDPEEAAQPDTQSLLQEFETVFDAVNHGQLTPPQSPPYEQPMLTTLESISATQPHSSYIISSPKQTTTYQVIYQRPAPESIQIDYVVQPTTPQSNIAHELAEVDELVRTRVKDILWSNPPSPGSTTSNSSNFGDSSSDDPEWIPETVEEIDASAPTKSRKRSKPYSRVPPEDKKSRKKEQNKNAATRYRMKKKAEVEEILGEERVVQNDNDKLANKITDLQREIKYLKGLMRDLFKAKGLIE